MLRDCGHLPRFAADYSVPEADVLLLALNLAGMSTPGRLARVRFQVELLDRPSDPFFMIIAGDPPASPFALAEGSVLLDTVPVMSAFGIENDDCVLSYFRRNRTVLTLNSNSRSGCVGCVFCHAALQDTSDPRLSDEERLDSHVRELSRSLRDLRRLTRITVCTGCFPSEDRALEHLSMVRRVFSRYGFTGQLHFIGSEIQSDRALNRIRDDLSPFLLSASIDCFTKRKHVLRPSKARVSLSDLHSTLVRARAIGIEVNFTYVLGIDEYADMLEGFKRFFPLVTRFPLINVLQIHSADAEGVRATHADELSFYLSARKDIETQFAGSSLRPHNSEGYRSLWYTQFADELMDGPRR